MGLGGMTKLALGATITVALILALFLTLFLLLLADFLSSLLRTRNPSPNRPLDLDLESPAAASISPTKQKPIPSALPSFYAHGVLQAPTSFLLTVPTLQAAAAPPPSLLPISSPLSVCSLSSGAGDQFVCISNPVYDRVGAGAGAGAGVENEQSTPFETPGTSPSHFGDEGEWSPPLGFMKKLPPVWPWIHGSVSATDTNRASSCSYSSSTLCFSPSW